MFGMQCGFHSSSLLLCSKQGEMLPFFPQKMFFWVRDLILEHCYAKKGGHAALFFQKCLGYNVTFTLLHHFFVPKRKCCPFSKKWVCEMFFDSWKLLCREMLPIFPQNVWYAMWLSLLLISSLFQTGGNAVLFSENCGVRFDSWGLFCNTGENAALFFKNFWGCNVTFIFLDFLFVPNWGECCPFSTKRMCNLILETCYVKQGKCCPFCSKMFVQCAFTLLHFFFVPSRGKCCPFSQKKFWACYLILEACYGKPGEMLPVLLKSVGDAMWLALLFISSLFQAMEMLPFFKTFGCAIWFLKLAM